MDRQRMDDDGWMDGLMNGWMMDRWIHYIYIDIDIHVAQKHLDICSVQPFVPLSGIHFLWFKFLSGFL